MIRLKPFGELAAQGFNLAIVEDADAGEVAVFVEEGDLVVAEHEALGVGRGIEPREEVADRAVVLSESAM
jgi:hypothetical protein